MPHSLNGSGSPGPERRWARPVGVVSAMLFALLSAAGFVMTPPAGLCAGESEKHTTLSQQIDAEARRILANRTRRATT